MPPWGRPPGGLDRRSRQEWEAFARQQWEQSRFEELGSDDSELDDSFHGTSSNMHYNSKSRQRHQGAGYEDLAYGEDYDAPGYDERDEAWQTEMREKEEELAARARRRIRRAHLRGEVNVDLTREELDAYERQRAREEAEAAAATVAAVVPARKAAAAPPARAALPAPKPKKKKSSGGFFSSAPSSSKSKGAAKTGKRVSLPLQESSPHDSSSAATPDQSPPVARSETPTGYFPPGSRTSSSPRSSRAVGREGPGSSRQLVSPPYPYDAPQQYRPASRGSPTQSERSFPDDPDWAPRSRASSSTNLYSGRDVRDPFLYQVGGARGFSGPASVSYSSLRRVPPPLGTSGASTVRMPLSDMQGDVAPYRRASASGLSREVAETSSEEESDESDDGGVHVSQTGASSATTRGTAGRVQARRGRR